MAEETVGQAARMIVDAFVDQQNNSDMETAFGPNRAAPSPALQQLIEEHAAQHGLQPDNAQLLTAVREEFQRRSMARRA
ncbi:MAG: hypothetical protein ACR2JY_00100 [Chloroflexota bacterium]